MKQTRRQFMAFTLAAATAARLAPVLVARAGAKAGARPVLTLVYDKGLGMMRAIDRLVP